MRFRNRQSSGSQRGRRQPAPQSAQPSGAEPPEPIGSSADPSDGNEGRDEVNSRGLEDGFDQDVLTSRDFRKRLDDWRQGDLLEAVPIAWAAPVGEDPLTGIRSEEALQGRMPMVTWDELAADASGDVATSAGRGWGIITSQTCDVAGSGPGARHHTVQVSPVVLGTGRMRPERLADARAGTIIELVHVPEVPEEGDWFADLRMSVPVSKAVLVTSTPRRGFTQEQQVIAFAEAVARKSRRPAVHDVVSDQVVPELSALVKDATADGAVWPDAVEQIRLEVLEGDRLWPSKMRLVVIGYVSLDADQRAALRSWQKDRARALRRATKDPIFLPGGIQLMACRFTDLNSIGVVDYRNTVPLGVDGLSGGAFW
ncbi:MAG: hypothetical protein QM747_12120 [Nocardioides sp.]